MGLAKVHVYKQYLRVVDSLVHDSGSHENFPSQIQKLPIYPLPYLHIQFGGIQLKRLIRGLSIHRHKNMGHYNIYPCNKLKLANTKQADRLHVCVN